MQLLYCGLSPFIGAHIGLPVRVEPGAVVVQQHDSAGRNCPMLRLERFNISRHHQIVGIFRRMGRDVDHIAGADQLADGHFVGGVGVFGEVDRRVHVGAAMLGG